MKKRENTRNDRFPHNFAYLIHYTDKHEVVKRLYPATEKIADFTTTYFEIAKTDKAVKLHSA